MKSERQESGKQGFKSNEHTSVVKLAIVILDFRKLLRKERMIYIDRRSSRTNEKHLKPTQCRAGDASRLPRHRPVRLVKLWSKIGRALAPIGTAEFGDVGPARRFPL